MTTSLTDFLEGEPLRYKGVRGSTLEATYRAGVGIFLERVRDGKDEGCADVTDDVGAARVYWNLIRRAEQ